MVIIMCTLEWYVVWRRLTDVSGDGEEDGVDLPKTEYDSGTNDVDIDVTVTFSVDLSVNNSSRSSIESAADVDNISESEFYDAGVEMYLWLILSAYFVKFLCSFHLYSIQKPLTCSNRDEILIQDSSFSKWMTNTRNN